MIYTYVWPEFVRIRGNLAIWTETDAACGVLFLPLRMALFTFVLVRSSLVWGDDSGALTLGTHQPNLLVRQPLPFVLAVLAAVGVAQHGRTTALCHRSDSNFAMIPRRRIILSTLLRMRE